MSLGVWGLAGLTALTAVRAQAADARVMAPPRVVVASKPFGESYVLAEMFAQLLEARGVAVDRRPGLGATDLAFGALRIGAIDVYPEYTGTGLLAILHQSPEPGADPSAVYRYVASEFLRRWGLRWLAPLGFQNSYAIAVRRGMADSLHLRTLTDLAVVASRLRAGLTADFIGRADGLPGLAHAYSLRFAAVHALLPAIKYQALAAGDIDVIDGYTTDGLIARYDLVTLNDDRRFFPPYEAAPLVSARLARDWPAAVAALGELGGRIGVDRMRAWNRRLEVDRVPVSTVATDALRELGLVGQAPGRGRETRGAGAITGLIPYLIAQRRTLLSLTARHLLLVGVSLAVAVLIAAPLGLALERRAKRAEHVIRAMAVLETIPGLALLAFMIPLLGIGLIPSLVALVLYSLYPIVRNTYTGVESADPAAVAAATALGMTEWQVLRLVRLPLAAPVIMAGIRTAAVLDVGTATLAAFIGAGGLGEPIVTGLALADSRMILSGAIPAAVLALAVDGGLAAVERILTPRH